MKILKLFSNLAVGVILVLAASGWFRMQQAFAVTGILGTRSITMTSSAASATKVQYLASFTAGTTTSVGGVVIDFCQQDPIPGDTCGSITGFSTAYTTYTAALLAAQTGFAGFAMSTSSTNTTLIVTNATPQSLTAGNTYTLTFGDGSTNGLTNPSTANAAFYARIFTFDTKAHADAYTSGTPGTYIDNGGIALTTTAQLVVTSKVQETLSLCIYTGANCGAGGTAISLGDANDILSTSTSYTNVTGKFDAATNAASGMTIFSKGSTLTNAASNTITPAGATAVASSPGNEQFGFCVATTGGGITGFGQYNVNNTNCNAVTTGAGAAGSAVFAFDVTSTPNLTSLGGQKIASCSSPSSTTTGKIAYLANIATTTKAGVYTETQTFIGIGTF